MTFTIQPQHAFQFHSLLLPHARCVRKARLPSSPPRAHLSTPHVKIQAIRPRPTQILFSHHSFLPPPMLQFPQPEVTVITPHQSLFTILVMHGQLCLEVEDPSSNISSQGQQQPNSVSQCLCHSPHFLSFQGILPSHIITRRSPVQ